MIKKLLLSGMIMFVYPGGSLIGKISSLELTDRGLSSRFDHAMHRVNFHQSDVFIDTLLCLAVSSSGYKHSETYDRDSGSTSVFCITVLN